MTEKQPLGLEITTANRLVNTLRERPTAAFPNVVWELEDYRKQRRERHIETTMTFDRMVSRVAALRFHAPEEDLVTEMGRIDQFGLPYRYKINKTVHHGVMLGQQVRYNLVQPREEAERINEGDIYTPYLKLGVYGFDDEQRHIGIEVTRYRKTTKYNVDVYQLIEGKDHFGDLLDPAKPLMVNDILAANHHVTRKLFVGDPGLNDDFQEETARRLGIL